MENLEARLMEVRRVLQPSGSQTIPAPSQVDVAEIREDLINTLPKPQSRFDAIIEMLFGLVVRILGFGLAVVFMAGWFLGLRWLLF